MFIAALFMTAKSGKTHVHREVNEGIHKMWYTHIMEYYSAIQRNEVHYMLQYR